MKKKDKNLTLDQHYNNVFTKKEQLPFHKMDDTSRRQFIKSIGYFMAAFSVPSVIRLETMSKISKKIFGNSMAFAATNPFENRILIADYKRAGYPFMPSIVACASDDDPATPANRNISFAPDTVVSTATTSGLAVKLPPHSAGLAPYANGIQGIQCFSSSGGHTEMFNGTYVAGSCELISARAKSEIDAGAQTLLTQPFGYFNPQDFAVQNVPAMLATYAPANYSNVNTVANLFTPPTLSTSQGNALSSTLKKNIFAAMESQFSKDVEKALYEKNKDLFKASNTQAFNILSANYQAALDPAQNATIMNQLTAGLPTQTRMNCVVNPAQAVFQIITAANLGITPRVGLIGFTTSDWHDDNELFTTGNAGAGTTRSASAAYIARLIQNVFDTAAGGAWTNPNTDENEIIEWVIASEFTRTNMINGVANGDPDNGDGQTNATLYLCSDPTLGRVKAGSFGRIGTGGQTVGFSTSTLTHSSSIGAFTTMQAFHHNAALFGIKPSDFNVSGSGIGGDMVTT